MPATAIRLPTAACLTVTEAHEYVGARTLFEHLIAHCGLQPLWDGKGHKKILYRVTAIDQALDTLELQGGWDDTQQKAMTAQ